MPARTASKKEAILAGRLTASRTCHGAFRYRAAKFGLYPSLRAMFKTRTFVAGFMSPRECRARSTVPFDKPKALAMSLIPTGRELDIAKALGLSNGTVDRALNSRGDINPATKVRVLNMARKL